MESRCRRRREAPDAPQEFVINDNLRLATGDTPYALLHHDAGTFAQYEWKLRGNDLGFGIDDVTAARVPVVIQAGAPSFSLFVKGVTGELGLGTHAPAAALHLLRSDGTTRLRVEEASSTSAERVLFHLKNKGKTRFLIENTDGNQLWTFDNNGPAGFSISKVGTGVNELLLSPTGDLTLQGILTQLSDRDAKRDFAEVDRADLLERVAALPVTR